VKGVYSDKILCDRMPQIIYSSATHSKVCTFSFTKKNTYFWGL